MDALAAIYNDSDDSGDDDDDAPVVAAPAAAPAPAPAPAAAPVGEALPSADAYLGLVMQFILAFGISFLMPVLLMLLNRAGFVTRAQLIGLRRYMIVAAFVLAAVLTPPDVVSQLMLAIPLLLLYEVTIIAIWFTDRNKSDVEDAEEAAA